MEPLPTKVPHGFGVTESKIADRNILMGEEFWLLAKRTVQSGIIWWQKCELKIVQNLLTRKWGR